MFVVRLRALFYILSGALIAVSIWGMVHYGFNWSIDFKGGAKSEFTYTSARPDQSEVKANLDKLNLGDYVLQPSGDKNFILRTREVSEPEKVQIANAFSLGGKAEAEQVSFSSIGPVIGKELRSKSYIAIGVVVLCIVLFITFAFRKVSEPVPSWKYGLATIVALAHDVVIPAGFFVIFSHFYGGEIDVLFVTALLAILGFSVHDTIVVFDRVRENLRINREHRSKEAFPETVGKSLTQTFGRSINTSFTIFIVLLVLFLLGGATTKDFALVLLVGIVAGTYSSIFVASPLLVTLEKLQTGKSR